MTTPEIGRALRLSTAAENLEVWARALPALEELGARSIPTIVLKSLPQVEELYGDVGGRATMDVDLIVPGNHAHEAMQVMLALGWKLESPQRFDILAWLDGPEKAASSWPWPFIMVSSGRPSVIDLHSDAMHAWPAPPLDTGIWKRAVPTSRDGLSFLSLGPEDRLLFLCWHLLQHATLPTRLPWSKLQDVRLALARGRELDWSYVAQRARATGLTIMLHLVCDLAAMGAQGYAGLNWEDRIPLTAPKRLAVLRGALRDWGDSPASWRRKLFWLAAHDHPLDMMPVWRDALIPSRKGIAADRLGFWPSWPRYLLTILQIYTGRLQQILGKS